MLHDLNELFHPGTYRLLLDLNGTKLYGTCRMSTEFEGLRISLDCYRQPSKKTDGGIPIYNLESYESHFCSTGAIKIYNPKDLEIELHHYKYDGKRRKIIISSKEVVSLRLNQFSGTSVSGYINGNEVNKVSLEFMSECYREISLGIVTERKSRIPQDILNLIADSINYKNAGIKASLVKSRLSISKQRWKEEDFIAELRNSNFLSSNQDWEYIMFLVDDAENPNGPGPGFIFPERGDLSRVAACIINQWQFPKEAGFQTGKDRLIEVPKAFARTFLHELGHGLGLTRDDSTDPPFMSLMRPSNIIIREVKDDFLKKITLKFMDEDRLKIAHFADSYARPGMSKFNSFRSNSPFAKPIKYSI